VLVDTYIMCMRALQLAEKERERMAKTGRKRKREREGGSDRKRGRGRALVLAEFIEVGVKKCYTCSKHTEKSTHKAWATYCIIKFINQKHDRNQSTNK